MQIERSTDEDLTRILTWLKVEDEKGETNGFYCNRRIIALGHKDGDLTVLREDGNPVAFLLGGPRAIDILEVCPSRRGMGFGRALVDFCLPRYEERDVCVVEIECEPPESIPFWKKMGFEIEANGTGRKFLYRSFSLPAHLSHLSVEISFYPEEAKYSHGIAPLTIYRPDAVLQQDGSIQLGQRAIGYPAYSNGRDLVISVSVDTKTIFMDKAKYDDAKKFGVRQAKGNAFFLDCIPQLTSASG